MTLGSEEDREKEGGRMDTAPTISETIQNIKWKRSGKAGESFARLHFFPGKAFFSRPSMHTFFGSTENFFSPG